jgi:glycosyltransferase involved in cell wall biosynthesis
VPKLEVLLPFHRNDEYLGQAISCFNQSDFKDMNLILIDDRKDDSSEIKFLEKLSTRFNLIKTSGGVGYGQALNLASNLINSQYVALMNSDDLFSPKRFRVQLELIGNSDLSICKMKRINSGGQSSRSLIKDLSVQHYDPIYLLFGAYGANATWLSTSEWWQNKVFFDSYSALDWRIAFKTFNATKIQYSSEGLYSYRRHQRQVTGSQNSFIDEPLVYSEWNKFATMNFGSSFTLSLFRAIATPWQSPSTIDWNEVQFFIETLKKSSYSVEVKDQLMDLVARRLLLVLRNQRNLLGIPLSTGLIVLKDAFPFLVDLKNY